MNFERRSCFSCAGLRVPKHLIESAVQVIFTIIFFLRLFFSLQRKLCPAPALGITPAPASKGRGAFLVSRKRVVTEYHVADFSVAVGDLDGHHRAAEIAD